MGNLDPSLSKELERIGVFSPEPENQLHRRLVDALVRTRGDSRGEQLTALQWVLNWDLQEQGIEFSRAKTDYERIRAKLIVKFRDAGEKSGEMAGMRADATDEVYLAHLRYRLAEQTERLARKRLDTISNEIDVWRSLNADRRKADAFHADN